MNISHTSNHVKFMVSILLIRCFLLISSFYLLIYYLIKSIKPYSYTKGTLRKKVCSRLIKLTCGTIVQTRVQRERRPNIVKDPEVLIP